LLFIATRAALILFITCAALRRTRVGEVGVVVQGAAGAYGGGDAGALLRPSNRS
jgi:hypothetical protein